MALLTYFWRSTIKRCGSSVITKERSDSVFVIPVYYHANSSKIACLRYMLSCWALLIFLLLCFFFLGRELVLKILF